MTRQTPTYSQEAAEIAEKVTEPFPGVESLKASKVSSSASSANSCNIPGWKGRPRRWRRRTMKLANLQRQVEVLPYFMIVH
jgi:hypothetical protein